MTQSDRLPHGMTIVLPRTALFFDVCRRLGVEAAPADSILVRYDQRSRWLVIGSIVAVLFILYRSLPLIADLASAPQIHATVLLALCAVFFGLFLVVFARFFFIAAFGVHWFLCAPEGIRFLRYSPVSSKARYIDRIAIVGFEVSGDGTIMEFRYNLAIALCDGKKHTLVKLDPSRERVQCLYALLERRCSA